MGNIEQEFEKEINRKNINNKSYLWILSILFFSTLVTIYSYETNSGIIAKQTIDKNIIFKNQANLEYLNEENKKVQKEILVKEPAQEIIVKNIKEPKIIKENYEYISQNNPDTVDTMNKETTIKVANEETLGVLEEVLSEGEIEALKNSKKEKIEISTSMVPVLKQPNTIITEEKESANLGNHISKISSHKKEFNIISCYSFEVGQASFSKTCEENFKKFIKENQQAKQYEVIGLIDIYDVLKLANKSESSQKKLAVQRVQSAKNFLKSKTAIPISRHSYYLKSEIATKGVVLRAYF